MRANLLGDDVLGLRAFLAFRHFHRYFLTLFQGLEAFHLDRTMMDKDICPPFLLDKAETFIVVEPLTVPVTLSPDIYTS